MHHLDSVALLQLRTAAQLGVTMQTAKLNACPAAKPCTTGRPTVQRRSVPTRPSSLSQTCRTQQQFPRCPTALSGRTARRSNVQRSRRAKRNVTASAAPDPLVPLGLDFLTFLAATVLVIPLFKSVKASPVLGFLFSGLLLGQLG